MICMLFTIALCLSLPAASDLITNKKFYARTKTSILFQNAQATADQHHAL